VQSLWEGSLKSLTIRSNRSLRLLGLPNPVRSVMRKPMKKLFIFLIFISFRASAVVVKCDIQTASVPWDQIVSITKNGLPKSSEEKDISYGVSMAFLKKFDGYEFKAANFVVDNYNNSWGSRFNIPLAVKEENIKFIGYVKLPAKEIGKHGVLVVLERQKDLCTTARYFPIDA